MLLVSLTSGDCFFSGDLGFWVYGVALKIAPCVLLSVLSGLLIRAMRAAELRHRRLIRNRRPALASVSGISSPHLNIQTCTIHRPNFILNASLTVSDLFPMLTYRRLILLSLHFNGHFPRRT